MKKICLQIPPNNKYVVACSFGPDSMALLDAAIKQKLNIVVAHVNYHHRKESNLEEKNLKKYCKVNKVKYKILKLYDRQVNGNFEAWAREKRYEFFSKVLSKNKANAILVAHHQDDLIETYLMQKKRGNFVKTWGIAKSTTIQGATIIRPLLKFTKADLLEYCERNNVPFSIDKTNLENEYERNKIRHQIVEKLSQKQRTKILDEIVSKNHSKICLKSVWNIKEFLKLSYDQIIILLDTFMTRLSEHKNISKSLVQEIKKFVMTKKANAELEISASLMLCKSYNALYFVNKRKLENYKMKISKPTTISNKFLDIQLLKNSEDRNISAKDYPLIIRNAKQNDKFMIKNYNCEVRRLFIDWKMPSFLRKVWPVVVNKDNKIIYIPRFRENFVDNHKTTFKINIDYFLA